MAEQLLNGPARAGPSGLPARTHYVDVTRTVPRKIAALRAHASQISGRDGLEDFLRERLARVAEEQARLPESSLAEGFQVLGTG